MRRSLAAVTVIVALLLVMSADTARSQIYPVVLPPGHGFTAPSGADTVFVISRPQMESMTLKAESLALADSTIVVLERKAALLGEIIAEQEGIIEVRSEAYVHYRDRWIESSHELEEAEVKVDEYRRDRLRWALISAVVLGLTGFAIGSAVN